MCLKRGGFKADLKLIPLWVFTLFGILIQGIGEEALGMHRGDDRFCGLFLLMIKERSSQSRIGSGIQGVSLDDLRTAVPAVCRDLEVTGEVLGSWGFKSVVVLHELKVMSEVGRAAVIGHTLGERLFTVSGKILKAWSSKVVVVLYGMGGAKAFALGMAARQGLFEDIVALIDMRESYPKGFGIAFVPQGNPLLFTKHLDEFKVTLIILCNIFSLYEIIAIDIADKLRMQQGSVSLHDLFDNGECAHILIDLIASIEGEVVERMYGGEGIEILLAYSVLLFDRIDHRVYLSLDRPVLLILEEDPQVSVCKFGDIECFGGGEADRIEIGLPQFLFALYGIDREATVTAKAVFEGGKIESGFDLL